VNWVHFAEGISQRQCLANTVFQLAGYVIDGNINSTTASFPTSTVRLSVKLDD